MLICHWREERSGGGIKRIERTDKNKNKKNEKSKDIRERINKVGGANRGASDDDGQKKWDDTTMWW